MAPMGVMTQSTTALVLAIPSVSLMDAMLHQCAHSHLTVLIHLVELNVLVLNCNQEPNNILNAANLENKSE